MSTKKYWFGAITIAVILILTVLAVIGYSYYRYRNRLRYVFVPNDISVTIPEGTNIADIERMISGAGVKLQDRLLTRANLTLEGTLFPDTYRFDRASSASDIITRMHKVDQDQRTLIIASLLEKEVKTLADMRIVAGIISKRLGIGMALQLDASVAYGACLSKFELGEYCDVSKVNIVDNIKRDTAYNTYTRTGLPAGPITNPGQRALDAARSPLDSEYWFYLSARDGTTIFSKTLDEHNAAKRKYLK